MNTEANIVFNQIEHCLGRLDMVANIVFGARLNMDTNIVLGQIEHGS